MTSFTVPGKGTRYQWMVTPMGLQGSPASFARLIDYVFRGITGVITYIDDILTHSRGHQEQLKVLEQTLLRLRKYNLKLNPAESVFGATSVHYLGYNISGEGIRPGEEKMKAIQDSPTPDTPKKIREFVGLANYFRFLLPGFAEHSAKLTDLFKKDNSYKSGPLPKQAFQAFKALQIGLSSNPLVAHPSADKYFFLTSDAATGDSEHAGGMGAVLSQMHDGQERVIP